MQDRSGVKPIQLPKCHARNTICYNSLRINFRSKWLTRSLHLIWRFSSLFTWCKYYKNDSQGYWWLSYIFSVLHKRSRKRNILKMVTCYHTFFYISFTNQFHEHFHLSHIFRTLYYTLFISTSRTFSGKDLEEVLSTVIVLWWFFCQ